MATFLATFYIIIAVLLIYGALDAVRKTDEYKELFSRKSVMVYAVYAAAVAFGILWIVSVPVIMHIWDNSDSQGGAK